MSVIISEYSQQRRSPLDGSPASRVLVDQLVTTGMVASGILSHEEKIMALQLYMDDLPLSLDVSAIPKRSQKPIHRNVLSRHLAVTKRYTRHNPKPGIQAGQGSFAITQPTPPPVLVGNLLLPAPLSFTHTTSDARL